MTTLQAPLDLARVPLNDAKDATGSDTLCRYPDATLLRYLLHGLLHTWRTRADLWVGQFANPPLLTWTATQTFPLPDEFIEPLADYVVARAESGDDEFVSNPRAAGFLQLFGNTVPV